MSHIVPHSDLHRVLLSVEKPGRYVGGEYGMVRKESRGLLRFAISYPDVYEIGMSNLAIRYLYRQLNAIAGVSCERVFAPAQDFEAELRARAIPLFSLETGTPLRQFDLIGFSVGYELTLTNLLNILDLGGIHSLRNDRDEDEPVVIAGGPAVTNPSPYGSFIDAVFIGEFESIAEETISRLAEIKARGASRSDTLGYLEDLPYMWTPSKQKMVRRVHWQGFGASGHSTSARSVNADSFPVPNIKTIQDHGVVEIMRGCPNGCRFCHAGMFYRPYRQKNPDQIAAEAAEQVFRNGYREITLSSLSSGDYPGLPSLVKGLTQRFEPYKVSFSLPSLRINSVNLDLMGELSTVRKSGLTFAVETPLEHGQRGLNKLASLERTIDLVQEARERGWRVAKFYFMVGLPVSEGTGETDSILEFLEEVRNRCRLNLNLNVSCFIPKPHTPFQWAAQLTEQQALDCIMTIKRAFSGKGVTVRYHSPFLSLLEGVLSRGDERAGELFHQAFLRGARFDSWEELVQRELWRSILAEANWDVEKTTCRERALDEALPWDSIQLGISNAFLKREWQKALAGEMTPPCCSDCRDTCGVCGNSASIRDVESPEADLSVHRSETHPEEKRESRVGRVLFAFRKQGKTVFLSHLNVMQIFERSLLRAGYRSVFTEGYNPKPRVEFAQPLSLGIASEEEIALAELQNFDTEDNFITALNPVLPEGMEITRARFLPPYQVGKKKHSLMSLYRGSEYRIELQDSSEREPSLLERLEQGVRQRRPDEVPRVQISARTSDQILLRIDHLGTGSGNIFKILTSCGLDDEARSGFFLTRTRLLAMQPTATEADASSYFDLELT